MTTSGPNADDATEQPAALGKARNSWQIEAMMRPGLSVPHDRLPQTIDFSANPIAAVAFGIIGVIAALMGLWLLGGSGGSDSVTVFVSLSMVVLGAFCGYIGYATWQHKSRIIFNKTGVVIEEQSARGSHNWQEGYAAFEGVLLRSEKVTWRLPNTKSDMGSFWGAFGGRRGPAAEPRPRTLQIVELLHSDAARTLPLYLREDSRPDRIYWARMAQVLGLPALELRDGEIISQTAEEALAAASKMPDAERVPDVGRD